MTPKLPTDGRVVNYKIFHLTRQILAGILSLVTRIKKIEPAGKLLTETREMLKNRPIWLTLQSISNANEFLPYPWLMNLVSDPNCRPAVNRVEMLRDHLIERIKVGA